MFEAMACETAVVSTRVGAVPELIVDGVNGYSADVDDEEALVSAIFALAQFPEKRNEIGKRGRETVSKRSWGVELSPLEGVYDELIHRRRRMGSPLPGPAWMKDPKGIQRASCAADALVNVIPRVRNGSMSVAKGIGLFFDILNKRSIIDIAKGAAMVRGVSFKTSTPHP